MNSSFLLASATVALGSVSILCLLILHFVSTEFKPGFRMVSEYAMGKHKWLLSIFFFCWGLCSISAGIMLWTIVSSGWAKFGVILFFLTGIGAIMGGLFDVKHKLHGLSFAIGVPFMPIAALLISYHLLDKSEWQRSGSTLLLSAHSIWISLVLMAGLMMYFFSSLKKAGIAFGPDVPPLTVLPKGVYGIHGWANRLLVLCYLLYPILVASIVLKSI
jgi:Protein of unknown function (DUF998)